MNADLSCYDGPFELYSDKKNKISKLSQKISMLLSHIMLNLIIGFIGLSGIFSEQAIDWIRVTINIINIFVVVLFSIPLLKLVRLRSKNYFPGNQKSLII